MQIHQLLLPRASGCVQCTSQTPVCNCPAGQQCIQIGQSCNQCIHYECVAPSSSSSGGGIGTGAVVGIVIAIVIIAALSVFGFLYWRRRQQAKIAAEKAKTIETKDVPAPAETVLRRPDPSEKAPPPSPRLMALAQAAQQRQLQEQHQQPTNVRMYDSGTSVIDLDPTTYGQAHGGDSRSSQNPFVDSQSIITTSTGSQQTNVIPIALVPPGTLSPAHSSHSSSPGGHRSSAVTSTTTTSSSLSSLQPPRPIHSPNMDHLNVSRDPSLAAAEGSTNDLPQPRRNSGNSYLTNASFASDLDAVIVTQSSRQVLGVAVGNAAVIRTPPARSPLAMAYTAPSLSSSVPPSPSVRSVGFEDPFNDAHHAQMRGSELGHGDEHLDARSSRATFGTTLGSIAPEDANPPSMPSHYTPPVAGSAARRERPVSNLTQAASVIGAEVVGATRVHLDYTSPMSSPRSPLSSPGANSGSSVGVMGRQNSVKRMTAARLVAPTSPPAMQQRHDQQQQQERATREVQAARAAAQERAELTPPHGMPARRNSSETMASAISARADSILESFPFVPPSPISNRPPRSPLAAEHQQHGRFHQAQAEVDSELVPPNRKMLGMSTGSELSNVSTGLGSYSFEIDRGSGAGGVTTNGNVGNGSGRGKTRASLDTLALTSDLASYPLGFDRPPMP